MPTKSPQLGPAPKKNYLRPVQRQELENDVAVCTEQLSNDDAKIRVQDRNAVVARKRRMERKLADEAAPVLTESEHVVAEKESKELGSWISDQMLSRDQMMKNPAGTVGANIKYHKQTKDAQLRWKALQLMLHPKSDDPDIANLERIRPTTNRSVSYEDSQIGGDQTYSVPTQQYMQNYDEVDWQSKIDTLEEKIQTLTSALEGKQDFKEKKTRNITDEDRENRRQRGREMAANRNAQRRAEKAELTGSSSNG